jgi:predicted dehydrogenase
VAGATAIAAAPFVRTGLAAAEDTIRIGVIGCGGRGTGAVLDAIGAATNIIYSSSGHTEDVTADARVERKGVQVIALADLFADRVEACRGNLKRLDISLADNRCFHGFDAYEKLLAIEEINYVILTTPPHFRPLHLKAAIEAGKHAFVEKPVAVDGPGVRMVLEASELAREKNLGILAGTQRRHQKSYQETVRRIQEGAIGELMYGRCYFNIGGLWMIQREANWSDMEWQIRNWLYFTWLGGDHIVEQHVHNLDTMNWVIGAHPIKATALGGRQARIEPAYGHIYDHFAVEFEYPNGVRVFSQCRQIDGCENKIEDAVVGSKGTSNCENRIVAQGTGTWRFREKDVNPYQQEHLDMIESIQAGRPLNEGKEVVESTVTAIMGRESAYSGSSVTWEQVLKSTRRLGPEKYEFGPVPVAEVAIPGKYKFL